MTDELQPLLTVLQTAKLLGITDRTLWKLTKRGDLPSIKIGRSVRYDMRDIEAFIKKQRGLQVRPNTGDVSERGWDFG